MTAIVKLSKYGLLLWLLVIALPLYVNIFITPDWPWLLFSLFFAAAYLFIVRPIKRILKVFLITHKLQPH